ncbi:SAM-dependent methyltransferase, partial [Bacillus thuringiensis]
NKLSSYEIINKPHYGLWCGRNEYTSYQDIVLTKKSF